MGEEAALHLRFSYPPPTTWRWAPRPSSACGWREGCYHPQLGSSDRLRVQNGAYTLQYKDGTTLTFNSVGTIATWQTPACVTVTFAYNAASPPQLIAAANGLGHSLTLSYNGVLNRMDVVA